MKLTRLFLSVVVALNALEQTPAFAQTSCSHASGTWGPDNYGITWPLSQSGSSISGAALVSTPAECSGSWSAYGTFGTGGDYIISASRPSGLNGEVCSLFFVYHGHVNAAGCNTEGGTWENFNNWGMQTASGSWAATKTCEIPGYETTSSGGGWSGSEPQKYVFNVNVANTTTGDLSGRKYRETNYNTGYDSCWYSGSPIPKFDSVTQPNPFYLDSSNAYIDTIGWGSTAITQYRNHGDAPCAAHIYQGMQISCGIDGAETYSGVKNNVLVAEIGVTTITTTRDGVQKSKTYP